MSDNPWQFMEEAAIDISVVMALEHRNHKWMMSGGTPMTQEPPTSHSTYLCFQTTQYLSSSWQVSSPIAYPDDLITLLLYVLLLISL